MTHLTDRTSIETDWACGQKRFWFLHAEGGGIVPASTPRALTDGIRLHHAFANLLTDPLNSNIEWEPAPDAVQDEWESWARLVGWHTAFREWYNPRFLEPHYEVLEVEHELVLKRGDLWVACTPDAILRSKASGKLVIIDFKTTSSDRAEWMESWPFQIQMHLNMAAVEEEFQEPVQHAFVIGLTKGVQRDGKLRHPYTWAYFDDSSGTWSTKWGRDRFLRPVWEYGSGGQVGVMEWALDQGPEVGMAQFPTSPPIVLDREMLEGVLVDRLRREQEVASYLAGDGDRSAREVFERRLKQCRPGYGPACPYLDACWNEEIGDNPLESGLFTKRVPHHLVEV